MIFPRKPSKPLESQAAKALESKGASKIRVVRRRDIRCRCGTKRIRLKGTVTKYPYNEAFFSALICPTCLVVQWAIYPCGLKPERRAFRLSLSPQASQSQ